MSNQGSSDSEYLYARPGPMLDVLNLVNMVSHYREELGQIIEGNYNPDLFSRQDEAKLSRLGVIERFGLGYVVPWEVEALMKRLK